MTANERSPHGRLTTFPARAVDDPRLGRATLRVLAALGNYANKDGLCYPSQSTLAKRMGITRQAVGKSIKRLVELGYIRVVPQYDRMGARRSNHYYLLHDMLPKQPPQPPVAPPQPDIAPPVTSRVASPATSEVAQNVPEERPKGTGGTSAPVRSLALVGGIFTPTPADMAWATAQFGYINLEQETGAFLDYARANGKAYVDWSAAWRNWIRKSPRFSPRRLPSEHNRGGQGKVVF